MPTRPSRPVVVVLVVATLIMSACQSTPPAVLGESDRSAPPPEPALTYSVPITDIDPFDAVIGDTVIIVRGRTSGENQQLVRHAIDRRTGETLWRTESDGRALGWTGVSAITSHGLYLEGFDQVFRAYDLSTGEVRWTLDAADLFRIRGDFVIARTNSIYQVHDIATGSALYEGNLFPLDGGVGFTRSQDRSIGVELATGEARWQFDGELTRYSSLRNQRNLPVALLYENFNGTERLLGIETGTGEIVWQRDVNPSLAKPSANGQWVVIHQGRNLQVIDIATGTTAWSTELDEEGTQIEVTDHAIIEGTGEWRQFFEGSDDISDTYVVDQVRSFDIATGRELWTADDLAPASLRISYVALEQAGRNPAAVILAGRSPNNIAEFDWLRILDPASGELRHPESTLDLSGTSGLADAGIWVVGSSGAFVSGDRLESFAGEDLGPFEASTRDVHVGDDVLVAIGDSVQIVEW